MSNCSSNVYSKTYCIKNSYHWNLTDLLGNKTFNLMISSSVFQKETNRPTCFSYDFPYVKLKTIHSKHKTHGKIVRWCWKYTSFIRLLSCYPQNPQYIQSESETQVGVPSHWLKGKLQNIGCCRLFFRKTESTVWNINIWSKYQEIWYHHE